MHMVFALLCFVVVIHWLIFPYPSGLLHWHCGNLTIAPVPAKQPWWIWINTSYEFIMNDCITTTKQSTTKPCAYFLGYTVCICDIAFIDIFSASVNWVVINLNNGKVIGTASKNNTKYNWSCHQMSYVFNRKKLTRLLIRTCESTKWSLGDMALIVNM